MKRTNLFASFFIGTFFVTPSLMSFHDVWRAFEDMDRQMHEMHKQMEQVFTSMAERTQANRIEAPDYELKVKEKDDAVVLSLELPKEVKSENISVELEDDILNVIVDYEGKIELKVSGNMTTLSASKVIKHEKKDSQGKIHAVSAGSSHMAQTFGLPARVDFNRREPQADLTDGILTITLAKKGGSQKIPVVSSGAVIQMQKPEEIEK
jgi:HSP20 family molecular chaperone IbpA